MLSNNFETKSLLTFIYIIKTWQIKLARFEEKVSKFNNKIYFNGKN